MRIAFDQQIFFEQSYGGVSRYITRLAHHLGATNTSAKIFAPIHRNAYLRDMMAESRYGLGVRQFPRFGTSLLRTVNQRLAQAAIRRWQPDIVHETYYSPRSSAPARCPTVVTVLDMIHERVPASFPNLDKTTQYKRIATTRADHIICISQQTRRDLIDLFETPCEKVSVVHLGVDAPCPPAIGDAQPATEKRSFYPRNPFLLYVGARIPYKNFHRLVRAVGDCADLRNDFNIVAFGGGSFTSEEQKMITSSGMDLKRVQHVSGSDAVLHRLYRLAAALVYPSLYEGFGLPPLEAMTYQCPVISSNTSSMPEVIGDAAEFFNPTSEAAIAAAIKRVVYSPARTQALVDRGLKRAESFTWQRCAEMTLEIYRKLTM